MRDVCYHCDKCRRCIADEDRLRERVAELEREVEKADEWCSDHETAPSARISALEVGLREALELLGPPGVASWKDLRIAELRKLVTP